MSWQSALRKVAQTLDPDFVRPFFDTKDVDLQRLVVIDFETYFDDEYTLKKLSTSEYVRDPRFKAQMMYLKVGFKPARIIPPTRIKAELKKINWSTHALLAHHSQFDGFVLSERYDVQPSYYYDTLSMARGLHSNEIGAGLDEVSVFYGGQGKVHNTLELTKGVREWPKALYDKVAVYCMNDGDECLRVFHEMRPSMPAPEMDLIDMIVAMFCKPVLRVNIPRVEAELKREVDARNKLLTTIIDPKPYYADKTVLKTQVERALTGLDRDILVAKRIIGSNARFTELLRAEGVDPPVKISPAWMKKSPAEREADPDSKWVYAFAKDDVEFANLPDDMSRWIDKPNLESKKSVQAAAAKSARLRALVDTRIAVKSTTNITRAERLLISGKDGGTLPAYYAYSRAHTHRLGGGDKRNLQNLKRGGELRRSIEAAPGHELCVADSSQIEARTNAKLWGQNDLLEIFRTGGDPYCVMATAIYGRTITKNDKMERFVGKVLTLGLGFQMGAPKLQMTLAKGALGGPPVFITLQEAQRWVNIYRTKNIKIQAGWAICNKIIEDMAFGRSGTHGPISWEKGCIWLPNGMRLLYPDLKKAVGQNGYDEWTYGSTLNGKPIRKKIYGGLLCENIVQALARIIVMYQLLELSKTMRIVLTTHDEGVAHVKARSAPAATAKMIRVMSTPPAWWPDLPLAAEGGHAPDYSK